MSGTDASAAHRVPLRVGLIAGEASGDTLGADLILALRRLAPDARFFGVAGPKMQAAGCEVWEPAESFAVMGLFEVLRHLPRLLRLLSRLKRLFVEARPDVFVGIDAPDTNLRMSRSLHRAGIPTVQYVSPQVWGLAAGTCPQHAPVDRSGVVPVAVRETVLRCTWHPRRVRRPPAGRRDSSRRRPDGARRALGLDLASQVVALLPGSRRGEVSRLAPDFAQVLRYLAGQRPALQFIAPMAGAATRAIFADVLQAAVPEARVRLLDGQAQTALIAADVVLAASGTATLEAALLQTADGGRIPSGRVDCLGAAPPETGQVQLFCAAESTCGSTRGRRVFSGTNCPRVDRSGALDVA